MVPSPPPPHYDIPHISGRALDKHENLRAVLQNEQLEFELEVRDSTPGETEEDEELPLAVGEWQTSYQVARAGTFRLSIFLSGHQIYGSPFEGVEITPSIASPNKCLATGEGLETAEAEGTNFFTITAVDAYGNRHQKVGSWPCRSQFWLHSFCRIMALLSAFHFVWPGGHTFRSDCERTGSHFRSA